MQSDQPDTTAENGTETYSERMKSLFRDMYSNETCRIQFAEAWKTEEIRSLAERICREHAFADLPILADALEEAGCCEPQIIQHLRDEGEHTQHCWVLRGVLGHSLIDSFLFYLGARVAAVEFADSSTASSSREDQA